MTELATEPFYPDRDDQDEWLWIAVEIAESALDEGHDLRGAAVIGHSAIPWLYRHAYPADPADLHLMDRRFKHSAHRQKLLTDTMSFLWTEWDFSPDTVLAELRAMVEAGTLDEPPECGHA